MVKKKKTIEVNVKYEPTPHCVVCSGHGFGESGSFFSPRFYLSSNGSQCKSIITQAS